jgi:hypothetical protein
LTNRAKNAVKPLVVYILRRFAMNEFADSVKEKLNIVLTDMKEYSWLFVNNPEKDFTRKRKLDFR